MGERKKVWVELKFRPLSFSQKLALNFYLFCASKLAIYQTKLVEGLERIRAGLAEETEQTKEMVEIYYRQSLGRATAEEIKYANKQFRDVLRSLGLGVIIVLPFAPITLPLIVKLGRKLGVEVLPDSFKRK